MAVDVACGLLLLSPAARAQSGPAAPMVQAGGARAISDHVFVIPDNNVGGVPNVGIVTGSVSTLVIDTGMGRRNGEIVVAEAQRVSPRPIDYLVTTHVHPEHDLGAQAFPAMARMIRSRDQVAEIAEAGMTTADAFRRRSEAMRQLLEGAEFRPASQTFETTQTIDLGGVTVTLMAMGPNHTAGDTVMWIQPDGVLFAGDLAMKAQPAFASPKSSLTHWLESLDTLAGLRPRIVVPSHGPLGDGAFITAYRTYLTTVRSRVATLKAQGQSVEAITQALTAEMKDTSPDAGRLAGAIRVAFAEAR